MTDLEKEYIHLSEIMFDDKEDAIQEVKEAGGIVRFEVEDGDYIYYGADNSPFTFQGNRLFDTLVYKKLAEPVNFPADDDLDKPNIREMFDECASLSNIRIMDYIQKLRSDIAVGAIIA